jgi:polyhydroxybutyrate depolymerase
MQRTVSGIVGIALATMLACGGNNAANVDAALVDGAGIADAAGQDPLVTARPFTLKVPTGYVAGQAVPLVVLLHGYSATAAIQDSYFKLSALSETRTFLLALPDGLVDGNSNQFWNASDACCNFFGSPVDDVAYLTAVVNDVKRRYAVDPKRVFLIGHSNGGFMSHRMACDRADIVAGIVSLAGAAWKDASKCAPTAPVAVLQVHGTADATIAYNGGSAANGLPVFPSATDTVAMWASKNQCTAGPAVTNNALDIVSSLAGADTDRSIYSSCAAAAAELWTINNGVHVPTLNANWAPSIYDWLMLHPKP